MIMSIFTQNTLLKAGEIPLRLAYNSDWPPYSSGIGQEVTGILPALMDEILVNRMGVVVEHHGAPWARVQHYVENGIMDAFITVPTEKRLQYATSSESIVYRFEMHPIVKIGSQAEEMLLSAPTVETLKTLKVCDMLANGWANNFYATHEITFHAVEDAATCLRLIDSDRLDVIIQPSAVGLMSIRQQSQEDRLRPLDHVYGRMEFTLLLSKQSPSFSALLPRFDATVAAMKADGSYDRIVSGLIQNPPTIME